MLGPPQTIALFLFIWQQRIGARDRLNFFNAWILHPEYEEFIRRRWEFHKIQGWAGLFLKEKFKLLKGDLKEWNKSVFGFKDR